jgi:FkbM family methyltransferase
MTKMVKAVLNGEFEITMPKHRADRPDWYTPEGWEKPRAKAMHERVGPGDVVYYVGAEEGEFPALCQMWGADVVLFEPNPKVWPNIKAIWEANKLAVPVCWPGFASNVDQPLWADLLQSWPQCAIDEVIGNHGFKELFLEAPNYPQIRIDDVATQTMPPTVISFDVEGSEWQVLRGAEQTLRDHRPTLFASIHPEFMFHQWGEYSSDFRNWIKGFGYQETYLDYQHELHMLYEPL